MTVPLTRTAPVVTRLAAKDRVLKNRACHSHLSSAQLCRPLQSLICCPSAPSGPRQRDCPDRSAFLSSADGPRSSAPLPPFSPRGAPLRPLPCGLPLPVGRRHHRGAGSALAACCTAPGEGIEHLHLGLCHLCVRRGARRQFLGRGIADAGLNRSAALLALQRWVRCLRPAFPQQPPAPRRSPRSASAAR